MSVMLAVGRYRDGAIVIHETGNYGSIADLVEIKPSMVTIGSASQDTDVKIFLGASDQYVLFDVGNALVTFAKTDVAIAGDLTITLDDISIEQGKYIYLDGQSGSEHIRSSAVGKITITASGTGADDITLAGTVTVSDDLVMAAGKDIAVPQGAYIYLDGNAGGEYVYSDTAGDLMVNATTNARITIGGTDEYDFNATTLAMNANTITGSGDIICNDAAGPTMQDEAATGTNPTLIPNRADETTGIGWATNEVRIVVSGGDEYDFTATTLDMNSNTLTEVGTIDLDGDLNTSTQASDIIMIADTDSALEFYDGTTKFVDIDTRVTVTGVANMTLTGMPATIVAASGVTHQLLALVPGTTTMTGSTGVTAMNGLALNIAQPTITSASNPATTTASTVYIANAPAAGGTATITAAYALHIAAGNMLTAGQIYSTSDTGVRFGGTFVPDQNRTDYAIAIGGRAGGVGELDVSNAASTNQNFDPIQMNFNIIGSDPTGTSQMNAIYLNVTHDTTSMPNYRIKGADWLFTIGEDLQDVYGAQKEIIFNAASITVGGQACVHGMVLDGGSSEVTCASWRVINATMRGSGSPVDAHGIMINAEGGLVVAAGLRCTGTGMQMAIQCGNGSYLESPVAFAGFPAAGTQPVVSGADASGDVEGSIEIEIGGVAKWLQYWPSPS